MLPSQSGAALSRVRRGAGVGSRGSGLSVTSRASRVVLNGRESALWCGVHQRRVIQVLLAEYQDDIS